MKGQAARLVAPQEIMETKKDKTKQKTKENPDGNKSVSFTLVQGPSTVVCMLLI
jgi:hypothetical protein